MKVITAPRFVRRPSLVASAVFVNLALGTGAAIAAESFQLEEVLVTARRVEEGQQSVPVALTALSQKHLDQQIVLDLHDLQTSMPGLFVATNSTGGVPTLGIRAAKPDSNTSLAVTAYLDDVPVDSTWSVVNMVYDMQSITTLRGPQGTLFGANSTGGAVIFRPNKPTNTFEGYAQVGVGDYSRQEFQGMVNLPVNEMLQLRLAGDIVRRDGFVENLSDNREMDDDEHESARLSVRLKLSDTLLNDTVVDYYHVDGQPHQQWTKNYRPRFDYNTFLGFSVPADWALAGIQSPPRFKSQINPEDPTWNKVDNYGVANTTTWEATPNWTLKNVIAYRRDSTSASQSQNDALQFVTSDGVIAYDTDRWVWEPSATVTWGDGRWTNKTGLFFLDNERRQRISYRVLGMPYDFTNEADFVQPLVESFNPLQANIDADWGHESVAFYNQLSVALSDELTFTAGVRYTKDESKFKTHNLLAFPTTEPDGLGPYGSFTYGFCDGSAAAYDNFDPVACTGTRETDSDFTSFSLSIENRFAERKMVYASLRTGYLVGGFNNQISVREGQVFGPEKVVSFEMGLKADWDAAGRPLRTNVAVFYGTYEDQQRVSNGVDARGVTFIAVQNASSSYFYGADIDVIYAPTDYFDLSLTYQHLIAEYNNYNASLSVPLITAAVDLEGEQLSQAPKHVFQAAATLELPLSPELGELSMTLSYFYRSDTFGADAPTIGGSCAGNTPETPVTICTAPGTFVPDSAQDFTAFDTLPSFGIFNLTAQWKGIAGTKFDADLWVKNLGDKEYLVDTNNQSLQFGWAAFLLGAPRTYGVRLRYTF